MPAVILSLEEISADGPSTYRHCDRLVIACARHGTNSVGPCRQTPRHCCIKATIAVASVIDTLEECKRACVRWRSSSDTVAQ